MQIPAHGQPRPSAQAQPQPHALAGAQGAQGAQATQLAQSGAGPLPYVAGQSNLTPPAGGKDLAALLRHEAKQTPDAGLAAGALDAAVRMHVQSFGKLTPEDLQSLPPAAQPRHTSKLQQFKGCVLAGAAAYSVSFLPGAIINTLLVELGLPPAAAASVCVTVAASFHALWAETEGGAIAANFGAYAAPDSMTRANYVSACARVVEAHISGVGLAQACADRDAVVADAIARVRKRRDEGNPLPLASESHPIATAALRAYTDELAFLSFAAIYIAIWGTAAPFVRDALRHYPDLKPAAAAANLALSAVSGETSGPATILTANLGRAYLQKADPPKEGLHSSAVRAPELARVRARIELLKCKRAALQTHLASVQPDAQERPGGGAQGELPAELAKALRQNRRLLAKARRTLRKLQSFNGRNELMAERLLAMNAGGKHKSPVKWLNGASNQRRLAAKVMGNIVAVLPFIWTLHELASRASQATPFVDPSAPGNTTQASPTTSFEDLLGFSISVETQLIAFWITRWLFHAAFELVLGAADGLGKIYANGGRGEPPPETGPDIVIHPPAG